jgi:hypothetical protein
MGYTKGSLWLVRATIDNTDPNPPLPRQGMARALLMCAEEAARATNMQHLYLHVVPKP